MALSCEPCACIPATLGDAVFQQRTLMVLCQILSALQGTVGENVNVAAWGGTATTLGQKAMAASVPVVIASDQSTINVALTAGTATIGDIRSITTSVTPGTAAANLGKAEDAGHTTGDTGVFALGVRNDTGATVFTTTNLDYSPIAVSSQGTVQVEILSDFQESTARGILKQEDAVAASGDSGVMTLAVIQATPTASAADGDYGTHKLDAIGRTWVTGSWPEDQGHSSGDVGDFVLAVRNDVGGTTFTNANGDYSPFACTNQGAIAVNISTDFQESTARGLMKSEDAVANSGDVGVMSLIVRQDTPASSCADGDYTPPKSNSVGALWVREHSGTIASLSGSAASNGNNTIVAAGTNKLKVFAITLSTASTTAMTCILQSGASGTEIWRGILQAGTTGPSASITISVPPPFYICATAAATLLNLNLSSANAVAWAVSYIDEA